jgi:hypothetical protein
MTTAARIKLSADLTADGYSFHVMDAAMRLDRASQRTLMYVFNVSGRRIGNYRILKCAICGERFIGAHSAKTCSEHCAEMLRITTVKQQVERERHRRKEMQYSSCAICHQPMQSRRSTKFYCSSKCQRRGHRNWGNTTKR